MSFRRLLSSRVPTENADLTSSIRTWAKIPRVAWRASPASMTQRPERTRVEARECKPQSRIATGRSSAPSIYAAHEYRWCSPPRTAFPSTRSSCSILRGVGEFRSNDQVSSARRVRKLERRRFSFPVSAQLRPSCLDRLRDLVRQTRDVTIATNLGIPRSTVQRSSEEAIDGVQQFRGRSHFFAAAGESAASCRGAQEPVCTRVPVVTGPITGK